MGEQFWGRAARASSDSQESGRPFNFWWVIVRRWSLAAEKRVFVSAGEFLSLVPAYPLSLAQDVTLHGLLEFLIARSRFEVELAIKRIKFEEITMRLARGRAGAVVADLAEVVTALALAAGQFVNFAYPLRQTGGCGRHIKQNPVRPGASGSVRIIRNESETLRADRRFGPGEFGRHIGAIAGEFFRHIRAIWKTCTGDRECHLACSLRRCARDGPGPFAGESGLAGACMPQRHDREVQNED